MAYLWILPMNSNQLLRSNQTNLIYIHTPAPTQPGHRTLMVPTNYDSKIAVVPSHFIHTEDPVLIAIQEESYRQQLTTIPGQTCSPDATLIARYNATRTQPPPTPPGRNTQDSSNKRAKNGPAPN